MYMKRAVRLEKPESGQTYYFPVNPHVIILEYYY